MPQTCCAPGCDTGNRSEVKARNPDEKISLFKFPQEENRRKLWIARVPRKNWDVSKISYLFLCEKHFHKDDFETGYRDAKRQYKTGKVRQRKALKPHALPSLWPNLPQHLSKPPVTNRKTLFATSESRKVNEKNEMEKKMRKEEECNLIRSVEELYSKLKCEKELSHLVIRKNPDWITVTSLTDTEEPKVNFSISYCIQKFEI